MAKTLAEIEKALEERYDGRLDEKKGMTYAAWEDITYAANRIFGPLGWSREFVVNPYKLDDGYACVLRVTIYFIDDEGNPDSIMNEAPGYNELSYTRDNVPMTDTAFKGCYADALKKCLQALGDAFGLFIGAEAKAEKAAAKNGGNSYTPRQGTDAVASRQTNAGGGKDYPPSAGQLKFLASLGYTDEDIAGMSYREWKPILDSKTRKTGTTPTPKFAPKAPVAPREDIPDDDLPF